MEQFRSELTSWLVSLGSGKLSHEFFNLVNSIGSAKSKQEEALIIKREAELLQQTINRPENQKMMREFLIRGLYCELLGEPVPFVYIHALNMTQSPRLLDKRVGYLCTSIFLNENHELLLLLLNSVRKDLDSTNVLEVAAALSCMSWLLNHDTVHAILPLIIEKVKNGNELVRKKAIILVMRCLQKDLMSTWGEVENTLRAKLCDTDPSVMAATLHCFKYVIELKHNDPVTYTYLPTLVDLVPSFVGILKQLFEKRLPSHYNYHSVHAPWVQIDLLRILRYLGVTQPSSVTHMSQVLKLILSSPADKMASCAVVTEAIITVCAFKHPDQFLLDLSAKNIALFLGATSQDLNYLGLTLLAKMVTINPTYATEHQAHVIACLENPDESIRSKTIELLYHMTNSRNLLVIVGKMLERLKKTTDAYLRTELVHKITTLAEKFSTDNYWFITTMNDVFLTAGEHVPMEVAHKFLRYIAEGATDDEAVNEDLRIHAVTAYMQLASNPQLSDVLQMVMAWVIGEYGYLVANPMEAVNALADLLDRPAAQKSISAPSQMHSTTSIGSSTTASAQTFDGINTYYGSEVKQWIVSALAKLSASVGAFPPHIREAFAKLSGSDNIELARRCQDYLVVIESCLKSSGAPHARQTGEVDLLNGASNTLRDSSSTSMLAEIFPMDAAAEDILPSELLSTILGVRVKSALASGARPYSKPSERKSFMQTRTPKEDKALRWKAYERPPEPTRAALPPQAQMSTIGSPQHAYNPMMTTREVSAPVSPMAAPSTPTSLASMSARSGPWSSAGFGKPSPSTPTSAPPSHVTATMPAPTTPSYSSFEPAAPTSMQTTRPEIDTYKPKLDSNQARLANALFSGVGDSPTSSPHARTSSTGAERKRPEHRTTARATTATQGATASHNGSTATGNLLDFPTTSPPTASSSQPPQSAPQQPIDLLGMDSSYLSSPPQANRPAEIDLLSMDSSQLQISPSPMQFASTSSSQAIATQEPVHEVMQFTGPSSLVFNPNGGQLSQLSPDKDNWNLSNFAKSNLVATFLESYPKPVQNSGSLSVDPFMSVSYLKAWTSEGLNLALFFGNRTSLNIANIVTTITLTQPLIGDIEMDNTTQLLPSSTDTSFELATTEIAPHNAAACVVKISIEDKISLNMSLSGSTSFQVHGQSKNIKFRTPVDFRDLVRPATRFNVAQFGAEWTSEAMRETKLRSSVLTTGGMGTTKHFAKSTADLATAVSEHNFGIVQVGKAEAVAACTLLAMAEAEPQHLLLHMKLDISAGTIDFTFRAHSQSLAEIASRYFGVIFG